MTCQQIRVASLVELVQDFLMLVVCRFWNRVSDQCYKQFLIGLAFVLAFYPLWFVGITVHDDLRFSATSREGFWAIYNWLCTLANVYGRPYYFASPMFFLRLGTGSFVFERILHITILVLNVLLMGRLTRSLVGYRSLSLAITAMALGTLSFNPNSGAASWSYLICFSLLIFQVGTVLGIRGINSGSKIISITSAILIGYTTLVYEAYFPISLAAVVVVWSFDRRWKILWQLSPHVIALLLSLSVHIYTRLSAAGLYAGANIASNIELGKVLGSWARLTFATFGLSIPIERMIGEYQAINSIYALPIISFLGCALVALILSHLVVSGLKEDSSDRRKHWRVPIIFVGISFFFGPILLLGLTDQYQKMVNLDAASGSYISSLGLAVLMISVFKILLEEAPSLKIPLLHAFRALTFCSIFACSVGNLSHAKNFYRSRILWATTDAWLERVRKEGGITDNTSIWAPTHFRGYGHCYAESNWQSLTSENGQSYSNYWAHYMSMHQEKQVSVVGYRSALLPNSSKIIGLYYTYDWQKGLPKLLVSEIKVLEGKEGTFLTLHDKAIDLKLTMLDWLLGRITISGVDDLGEKMLPTQRATTPYEFALQAPLESSNQKVLGTQISNELWDGKLLAELYWPKGQSADGWILNDAEGVILPNGNSKLVLHGVSPGNTDRPFTAILSNDGELDLNQGSFSNNLFHLPLSIAPSHLTQIQVKCVPPATLSKYEGRQLCASLYDMEFFSK